MGRFKEGGVMLLGCECILRTSKEIQEKLDLARTELEGKRQQLLESKSVLIRKLRDVFPGFVDGAIRRVVEKNASRIDQLSNEELGNMKMEIEKEKPKAIENAFRAFDSSQDWLWCPSSSTRSKEDPFGFLGIGEEGPIWKLLEEYSRPLEEIFARYGLSVTVPTVMDRPLKPPYRFLDDPGLKELDLAAGRAHEEFCQAKRNVETLERELKEIKALEKFESA
jgi:hypothetical protein